MEKLTENLNVIQNLPDRPTLNTNELKAKFDEASGIIKKFLNEIVEPAVTKIETDYIKSNDLTVYKKEVQDTLDGFSKELDTFESTVNGLDEQIQTAVGKATNYGDFAITTHAITLSTNIQYGRTVASATYAKSGYIPLGIVGTYFPYDYYQQWALEQYRITNSSSGSCTVEVTGKAGTAEGNKTYSTTVTLYILWVKVK